MEAPLDWDRIGFAEEIAMQRRQRLVLQLRHVSLPGLGRGHHLPRASRVCERLTKGGACLCPLSPAAWVPRHQHAISMQSGTFATLLGATFAVTEMTPSPPCST
jgi:hypothetical protein